MSIIPSENPFGISSARASRNTPEHPRQIAPKVPIVNGLYQLPEFVLRQPRLLDDLLQQPTRQFLAVYWHDRRALALRMSVCCVRSLLSVKQESCAFKCFRNFPRAGAR